MNKTIAGIVAGIIIMSIAVFVAMPKMMINVHESSLGFEETVAALEKAVAEQPGWKVPKVFDIQKNIIDAKLGPMTRVKIVTLCNPKYAKTILTDDRDKMVSTMMPLGIGVYETTDGRILLSDMNIGLMGMMFGGTIAEVMSDASEDIKAIIGKVAK
jgi:uncharacterized protein (DUF302 family)